MTAIIRLRLAAYLRAYLAIAPTLAGLIVLAILYGGGVARPEEAYGVSALVLFPVLAWQVKILLDAEPDVQRRLIRVAAGSPGREIGAGLLAAATTAVPTLALGLVLPWLFGGVGSVRSGETAPLPLFAALAVGVWVHLIAVPPAVAVGAWASRPVSRTAGVSVSVLAGGTILAIVLGLSFSPIPWLMPPLMAAARATSSGLSPTSILRLTAWSLLWTAIVGAGYWRLRLRRV